MSDHEIILPQGWPKPKGYSNAVLTQPGRTLYLAGQVGWNEREVFESERLVPQFQQALRNVVTLVENAGGRREDIVKMTCFCKDRNEYLASRKDLGGVWREVMGPHYPCMSMIFVVDLLDHPALIEIEATAVIPN